MNREPFNPTLVSEMEPFVQNITQKSVKIYEVYNMVLYLFDKYVKRFRGSNKVSNFIQFIETFAKRLYCHCEQSEAISQRIDKP